jgi:hypothetical protein
MVSQAGPSILSQQLLLSVVEQLKLPLLQIARHAEHAQIGGRVDYGDILTTAENAINLLESYSLGVRLSLYPQQLDFEPVSISSVLYDTAQQLDGYAKSYGVALELSITGRFAPVLVHRKGLQAALVSLGSALIEALPALESHQLTLRLATHNCRYGIVAGLYTDAEQLSSDTLRRGRQLQGVARQPLAGLSHNNGAGIFVADAILQAMQLELKVSRHHCLYGLEQCFNPVISYNLFSKKT